MMVQTSVYFLFVRGMSNVTACTIAMNTMANCFISMDHVCCAAGVEKLSSSECLGIISVSCNPVSSMSELG